ncbi:MAG: hypothetical protein FWH20_06450 [Oscillospiraceae bacterium]|nr:hypothetical protein [Oscillospiraceae bacterium]
MVNEARFDFLQETDLKSRLWEKMQERLREIAPVSARQEISFDTLDGGKPQQIQSKPVSFTPLAEPKKRGVSK